MTDNPLCTSPKNPDKPPTVCVHNTGQLQCPHGSNRVFFSALRYKNCCNFVVAFGALYQNVYELHCYLIVWLMLGTTGSQDTTEENGSVVDAPPFGQHAIYPTCHHCLRHSRTYHHVYHWKMMAMILMLELTTMLLSTLKVHKNLMKKKFLKLVKTLRHQTVVDKSEQGGQVVDIPPAKLAKLKKFLSLNKSWQRGGNLLMASRRCCWRG